MRKGNVHEFYTVHIYCSPVDVTHVYICIVMLLPNTYKIECYENYNQCFFPPLAIEHLFQNFIASLSIMFLCVCCVSISIYISFHFISYIDSYIVFYLKLNIADFVMWRFIYFFNIFLLKYPLIFCFTIVLCPLIELLFIDNPRCTYKIL